MNPTHGGVPAATAATTGTHEEERRRVAREPLVHVACEIRDAGILSFLGFGQTFHARILDLSERGMRLIATGPVAKNGEVRCRLRDGKHGSVEVRARVVWTTPIAHTTATGDALRGMVAGLIFRPGSATRHAALRAIMNRKSAWNAALPTRTGTFWSGERRWR